MGTYELCATPYTQSRPLGHIFVLPRFTNKKVLPTGGLTDKIGIYETI